MYSFGGGREGVYQVPSGLIRTFFVTSPRAERKVFGVGEGSGFLPSSISFAILRPVKSASSSTCQRPQGVSSSR